MKKPAPASTRAQTAAAAPPRAAERIRESARELFYREGIRAIGVDEIVNRAGVTKPSLYRSFASKDDLAAAYLQDYDAAFWERIATSYAGLGSDLRDVPLASARLFLGRDTHGLRTALVFYRSAVGVLRRWGVWDPRQAVLAEPEFSGMNASVV